MDENTARQARMMALLDQAIAASEESARRALVATPANTDEGRAFLQSETDLDAMVWHSKHPRTNDDPDEIVGCFITVDHGHGEMFVAGFETFELETGYQVYNEMTLTLAAGSTLRLFDKTNAGNVQCSVSGRRVDL